MLIVPTADPAALLDAIKTAIQEGRIETWTVDQEGDFKHTAEQFSDHGIYFRPSMVSIISLRFTMLITTAVELGNQRWLAYSFYHSRMAEMIICNFNVFLKPREYIQLNPVPPAGEAQW